MGFNVSIEEDVGEMTGNVKILTEKVIYKLIDEAVKFRKGKSNEIEKERLMGLSTLCKLRILKQFVFRNSNPAVFGVRVETGKLVHGLHLMDETSEKIARVKNIQSESKPIQEATEAMEVAMSLPGVNFERVLGDREFLYSDISESQFKSFKKNKDLLSGKEMALLQEIAEVKRKTNTHSGV